MNGSGQLHAPAALHLGKDPPVRIEEKSALAKKAVWLLWSTEKNLLALPVIEPRPPSP
jgi:hypothetical protein